MYTPRTQDLMCVKYGLARLFRLWPLQRAIYFKSAAITSRGFFPKCLCMRPLRGWCGLGLYDQQHASVVRLTMQLVSQEIMLPHANH